MIEAPKIGVIGGGGWLGGVIIKALFSTGVATADQLGLSYRSADPLGSPASFRTRNSQELADWADIVIVSVRPQDWPALQVKAKGKLAISIMAGIVLQQLMDRLGTDRVVRAMPNVAAEVSRSFTPWAASNGVMAKDRSIVTRIFGACGTSDEVPSEEQIDYFTGFTGSGPAFPALLAEALRLHATSHGIPPDIAARAAREVLIGTGRIVERSPESLEKLVDDFVAYKGVVAAAINAMREEGFERSVSAGLEAALRKTNSLKYAS